MTLLTQDDMFTFMPNNLGAQSVKQFGKTGNRVTFCTWELTNGSVDSPGLDFHLLDWIMEGRIQGEAHYDTETGRADYIGRPGSVAYHQPGQPMKGEFEGPAKYHQIYIDNSVFLDVAANFSKGDPANIKTLGFNGIHDPALTNALTTIMNETILPSAASQLMIDAAAQQIAIIILRRNIERPIEQNRHRALSPDELNRAIDFIEDNIAENEGLDAIAKTIGMSTFYFARAFKEAINMAPHQYLIERRITRAKEMLSGSKEPIAGIAFDCGFSSQSHMTNVFAKRVGVSPRKYRQEMQK